MLYYGLTAFVGGEGDCHIINNYELTEGLNFLVYNNAVYFLFWAIYLPQIILYKALLYKNYPCEILNQK